MLNSLEKYLEERKQLILCRQAFFLSLKAYLGPEQRPEAGDLNEPLWNSPARQTKPSDWVVNPVRGYLVLREDRASRPFRLQVEQPGGQLIYTLSLPLGGALNTAKGWVSEAGWEPSRALQEQVSALGLGEARRWLRTLPAEQGKEALACPYFQWAEDARELYTDARAFENAHYHVWSIFNAAILNNFSL